MSASRNSTRSCEKKEKVNWRENTQREGFECKIVENQPHVNDPTFQKCLNVMKSFQVERAKQANDSYRVFYKGKSTPSPIFTPEMFAAYPESPTATRYKEAFDLFLRGWYILENYNKRKIENIEDCDYIQDGFHCYAYAGMREQHLFCQFRPPENTIELIDQYLKFRPEDTLAEYLKVIIILKPDIMKYKQGEFSDYELQKRFIITGEEFVHKRMPYVEFSELDKEILKDIYYTLGAIYVTTDQSRRALDSFQKCYELDTTNYSALYGIAYQYMERDPDKAISFFMNFIDKAPTCDKQYPNAHYMLAYLFFVHYKNKKEALRYCKLAEDAEKKRLSFLSPVDIPQKSMMQMIKSLHQKLRS